MGLFDNARFAAPTGLEAPELPNLADVLEYRDRQRRQNIDDQEAFAQFQSNLKLRDIANSMVMQNNMANLGTRPKPMNTVFLDRIDPYKQGLLDIGRAKVEQAGELGERKLNQGEEKIQQTGELGTRKLDITEKNNDTKNSIAQQGTDIKAYLASLHNLPDSEKLRLLQEGKVSIENIKDAAAMARTVQQGENAVKNTKAKGEESRKTKGTPSADAGVTSTLPSQQIKEQQLRANQAVREHPEWKDWVSIDPNTGLVQITPPSSGGVFSRGPSQDQYNAIKKAIGSPRFTLGSQAPNTTEQPPADTTTKPSASAENDMVEMLTPDGKSSRMVPKASVEQAKGQGYKIKS